MEIIFHLNVYKQVYETKYYIFEEFYQGIFFLDEVSIKSRYILNEELKD